jgi:hypothetical protein
MSKRKVTKVKDLDWSEFSSSLPKEGVVYPKGEAKQQLIARLRGAFRRIGLRQTA